MPVSRSPVTERMSVGGLEALSCDQLRQLLVAKDAPSGHVLLLDCRPFLTHNESHIFGSFNVHFPQIIRRRTGNRMPLRTIIPDERIRERLAEDSYHPIVIYEESDPTPESIGQFVAKSLQMEAGVKSIHFLEGGFLAFRTLCPLLVTCINHPLSASASNIGARLSPLLTRTWPSTRPQSARASKHVNSLSVESMATPSDQAEPVEILDYLFLGNESHASCKQTLKALGISALLNVSHTCPNHFEDCFEYKAIPIEDSKSEDISQWFQEAIDFIDSVKNRHGKVLVHCHAGISRSATICMAYLMASRRLRMEEAYEFVKSRRKIVSPNFNFMGQLLGFETTVFDAVSPQMAPLSPHVVSGPSSPSRLRTRALVMELAKHYSSTSQHVVDSS